MISVTPKIVSILGSAWTIRAATIDENKDAAISGDGIDSILHVQNRTIIVREDQEGARKADFTKSVKRAIREGIIRAFIIESGLSNDGSLGWISWSNGEKIIAWFAQQHCKMTSAFRAADAIDESDDNPSLKVEFHRPYEPSIVTCNVRSSHNDGRVVTCSQMSDDDC